MATFEQGRKIWNLTKLTGQHTLDGDELEKGHKVFIDNCTDATIIIKKKVTSVQANGCTKVNIIVEGCVSGVELNKCTKTQIQAINACPSFQIDKCIGVTIHLSKESKDASFTTCQSGEMNVLVPNEAGDDTVEHALPEQFMHKFGKDGKLTSEVSMLY